MKFKEQLNNIINISRNWISKNGKIHTYLVDSLDGISENCWENTLNGGWGGVSLDYIDVEQCYKHLCYKTNLPKRELLKEISAEEIDESIRCALQDIYDSNYADEWTKAVWGRVTDAIRNTYGSNTKVYLTDGKAKVSIYAPIKEIRKSGLSELSEIEIEISRAELEELYLERYYYSDTPKSLTMQEMFNEIEIETANTDFRYEEEKWQYNDRGWYEHWKNVEEISYEILQNRKRRQGRLKAMIRNRVSLQDRQEFINS